jgi:hypothetical protein
MKMRCDSDLTIRPPRPNRINCLYRSQEIRMATARPAKASSRKTPTKLPATGHKAAAAARTVQVSPTPVSRDAAAAAAPSRPAKVLATVDAPEGKAKQKLVRDSFTIPKPEYAALAELKQRSARLGHPAKKSEVLRAGIAALKALPDAALLAALQAVPSLKTGRPKVNGKR